jgi:hypothetical protein
VERDFFSFSDVEFGRERSFMTPKDCLYAAFLMF